VRGISIKAVLLGGFADIAASTLFGVPLGIYAERKPSAYIPVCPFGVYASPMGAADKTSCFVRSVQQSWVPFVKHDVNSAIDVSHRTRAVGCEICE
jgi:hypothetical protein